MSTSSNAFDDASIRSGQLTDPPSSESDAPCLFFEVEDQEVRGDGEENDREEFAMELALLQNYAQAIGAQLDMQSISHGTVSGAGRTMAFRFSRPSEETKSELKGFLAQKRIPSAEAMRLLRG